ncbi:hypothetical protein ACIU06_19490 [Pseudomonas aeruginosa]
MREENFLSYKKGDGTPSGNPVSISIGSQEKFSTLGQSAGQQGERPAATSLLKQCVTHLRGIVEALDNIHHTSPQRWLTDLDDVHSSAESLLALINDQAPTLDSQGLAGAALAQPSPAPELPERGTQHRFSTNEQNCRHDFAGVWWNDNGETKTGRECRHCGFFVADVAEAAAEQAEAERQEVVDFNPYRYHAEKIRQRADGAASAYEAGRSALGYMEDIAESALIVRNGLDELSAQHERITAKLHDALDESDGDRWKMRSERDAANARLHEVATACATAEQERDGIWRDLRDARAHIDTQAAVTAQLKGERDAALARVAELEKQEPVATVAKVPGEDWNGLHFYRDLQGMQPGTKLYAAPVAQAQHSVPEGYALVPLEPTDDMLVAGQEAWAHKRERRGALEDCEEAGDVYRAMLAAAPGKEGL